MGHRTGPGWHGEARGLAGGQQRARACGALPAVHSSHLTAAQVTNGRCPRRAQTPQGSLSEGMTQHRVPLLPYTNSRVRMAGEWLALTPGTGAQPCSTQMGQTSPKPSSTSNTCQGPWGQETQEEGHQGAHSSIWRGSCANSQPRHRQQGGLQESGG